MLVLGKCTLKNATVNIESDTDNRNSESSLCFKLIFDKTFIFVIPALMAALLLPSLYVCWCVCLGGAKKIVHLTHPMKLVFFLALATGQLTGRELVLTDSYFLRLRSTLFHFHPAWKHCACMSVRGCVRTYMANCVIYFAPSSVSLFVFEPLNHFSSVRGRMQSYFLNSLSKS